MTGWLLFTSNVCAATFAAGETAQAGVTSSCKWRQHHCAAADAACVGVSEVALCDYFFSWARSTNKQLANRKSARYYRGQHPSLQRLFFFFFFLTGGLACTSKQKPLQIQKRLKSFRQKNKTKGNI